MAEKETTMNKLLLAVPTLAAVLMLSGCANTISGAKEDSSAAAQKAQEAAAQTGEAVKDSAQKAGKAVAEVPQNAEANAVRVPVKTAILRDPVLADSRNLINVGGRDRTITLTGHVAEASMKQRAAEDAKVALKKHPDYTLNNELTVAGATQ